VTDAFICDAIRTPIGRYGGALSSIRADDLGALPIAGLIARNPDLDWAAVDDLIYGCSNQAGEDNRNVARMCALLAGLPASVPGSTVNRLCASGMEAVGLAARTIKAGDADLIIAGGVESMSRAPFVMGKNSTAFGREAALYDTTLGWRFVNPLLKEMYGTDSMPETADNVAADYGVSREDQDAFALRSQQRWAQAAKNGYFNDEIMPVTINQRKGDALIVHEDEHPRSGANMDSLSRLKGINGPESSVTAGNASGVNDGACALLIASENAVQLHKLTPRARVLCMGSTGVLPRVMGIGPASASQSVLTRAGLSIKDMDLIELNEAFAAQALAVLRELGVEDDAKHVNAQGGAIAMGHPLGMSGARLVTTAVAQLQRNQLRYALCTLCVGVGQGVAMIIERV